MRQYLTGGKGRGCLWWASSQGEPRQWGIKERGGGGVNENIKKKGRGVEWPCLWHTPCFGDSVFSLVSFGTCCLCFGGGGGGMVGYEVATLGVMLLAMVLMLAGGAKPGQC